MPFITLENGTKSLNLVLENGTFGVIIFCEDNINVI